MKVYYTNIESWAALGGMSLIFKLLDLAGKIGYFYIKYYTAVRPYKNPLLFVGVRTSKFLVRVGKLFLHNPRTSPLKLSTPADNTSGQSRAV